MIDNFKQWFHSGIDTARERGTFYHAKHKVDAEAASWLLESFNYGNRDVKPRRVKAFEAVLQNGQFQTTSQGISFAENGQLNNGQHRLTAIRNSGVEVELLFCFGEPRTAFSKLDVGGVRTASDVVLIDNIDHHDPALLAASATLWMGIKEGALYTHYSPDDVLAILELAPELRETTRPAKRIGTKLGKWGTKQSFAVAFAMILQAGAAPDLLATFQNRLHDGAEEPMRSPILILRDGILGGTLAREDSGKRRAVAVCAAVIITWNAWIARKRGSIAKLAWNPDNIAEFPLVELPK